MPRIILRLHKKNGKKINKENEHLIDHMHSHTGTGQLAQTHEGNWFCDIEPLEEPITKINIYLFELGSL